MTGPVSRDAIAVAGERLAAEALEQKGYRVIGRRVRTRLGEIDLIVERASLVVFVEVKSRRSLRHGAPAEAVGARKAGALRRIASLLLATRRDLRDRPARIDVVEVHFRETGQPEIAHLEDVLDGPA